jgi:hypothetical protein
LKARGGKSECPGVADKNYMIRSHDVRQQSQNTSLEVYAPLKYLNHLD